MAAATTPNGCRRGVASFQKPRRPTPARCETFSRRYHQIRFHVTYANLFPAQSPLSRAQVAPQPEHADVDASRRRRRGAAKMMMRQIKAPYLRRMQMLHYAPKRSIGSRRSARRRFAYTLTKLLFARHHHAHVKIFHLYEAPAHDESINIISSIDTTLLPHGITVLNVTKTSIALMLPFDAQPLFVLS